MRVRPKRPSDLKKFKENKKGVDILKFGGIMNI